LARLRIGDLLCERGLLVPQIRDQILETQAAQSRWRRFGELAIDAGVVAEEEVYRCLGELFGLPYIDLDQVRPSADAVGMLPAVFVRRRRVVPVDVSQGVLTVAFDDRPDFGVVRDIRFITGAEVRAALAKPSSLARALKREFSQEVSYDQILQKISVVEPQDLEPDTRALERAVEDAPVVALVNAILADAIRREASDVHVEPQEDRVRVRFRIDGLLCEGMSAPVELKYALLSRIKVMAGLDIAERRLPQDGRIRMRFDDGQAVDLRVSTLPSLLGEKAVIRILGQSARGLELSRLGFEPKALLEVRAALERPHGMILVTGPTGSGKSTTLYAMLRELNHPTVNIAAAEDPIEYRIPGVTQVQVNEAVGLGFATCLRAFLRQDPDVIMIGEIRDYETAEIAVKAALTGHLLLSTLHTNDAPASITRLVNMGIEPFLIGGSLSLVVAQRLLRRVCPACRERWTPPAAVLRRLGPDRESLGDVAFFRAVGCEGCSHTGYHGRIAIYEVLPISPEIAEAIVSQRSEAELRELARSRGMRTLRESALTKLRAGLTTIEEVLRVSPPDPHSDLRGRPRSEDSPWRGS
jgi:type IV pilus assembly protein PilB